MYKAFIEPDLKKAHLRIYNSFNPFSGFMDATYILKSAKHVTAEAIREVLPVSSPVSSVVCQVATAAQMGLASRGHPQFSSLGTRPAPFSKHLTHLLEASMLVMTSCI